MKPRSPVSIAILAAVTCRLGNLRGYKRLGGTGARRDMGLGGRRFRCGSLGFVLWEVKM
jgi:hypothetical protein